MSDKEKTPVENKEEAFEITKDGKTLRVNLEKGQFYSAGELKKHFNLRSFDPGLANTAVVHSSISSIDGEKGELRYRGYPIDVLVERCSFLEVAYLLIHGELPTGKELHEWNTLTLDYTFVHEDIKHICSSFRHDAHPMGFLISSLSALGTFYPDSNPALQGRDVYRRNPKLVNQQIYRVLGKLPTLAAFAYRHRIGRPYNQPATGEESQKLGYIGNFFQMLDRMGEQSFTPNPRLVSAMEKLFIIHAEHGLNASTAALRHVSSCGTDAFSCMSAACTALYGPSHGGANQAVLEMLERDVGTVDNIPSFLERVKRKEVRLMGFGHRVYRNHDPRSKLIHKIADEVFDVCGRDPLIEVAEALAAAALKDEYFTKRMLFPNVDFYSGLIYRAVGFPTDMFPVLFALGRVAGWLAHWKESLSDNEEKIYRPGQIYTGPVSREFVPLRERSQENAPLLEPVSTSGGRAKIRRNLYSRL